MKLTDPQIRVRLPSALKRWLVDQADRNCRSVNAEVVVALQDKMATTGSKFGDLAPSKPETETVLETIYARNT